MRVRNQRLKLTLLIFGDIMLLYGALFGVLTLRYTIPEDTSLIRAHVIPFTLLFFIWLILFGAFGLYDFRLTKNTRQFFYRFVRVMATNMLLAIMLFYLVPFFEIEPRRNLFLIAATASILIGSWRYFFNYVVFQSRASRIIFFGVTKEVRILADLLKEHPELGYRPVAFITENSQVTSAAAIPSYAAADHRFARIASEVEADLIVVTREIKENTLFVKALLEVLPSGIIITEFTAFHEMITGKIPLSVIGEVWFLENLVGIKKPLYEFFKRLLDVGLSVLLMIPATALFPFLALAIRLDSEGSILYRQKRVGRHGKVFLLYKFRSMIKDADKMSGFKGNGPDPRHTRVGAFLRKSYLDELPQILNVLHGEMSFVGPRPERPEYVKDLTARIPFYEMRLLVSPGLTGWAQINMENDASVEDAPEKMQYDLYYVKNRSLVLDLLISLRTAFTLMRRRGR